MTTLMRTTVIVLGQVSAAVSGRGKISPHTPLWGNPHQPHLSSIPDPSVWANFGIKKLQHIMPDGRLLTFYALKLTFALPSWMFFQYLQLRHAIQTQFPTAFTVSSHTVEHFLIYSHANRLLSSLYLRISCHTVENGVHLF